jgi:MFS family permease
VSLVVNQAGLVVVGFALVGAGFSTIVPLVFSAAGRDFGMSPGAAIAAVSTVGYFGFLVGPPLIGFSAELLTLRGALSVVVILSGMIVILSGTVKRARPHHYA